VACAAEGGSTTTTGEVVTTTTSADPTTTAAPLSTTTAADAGFPVTVEAANGEVTVPDSPTRIVSLAPTATEMLFAIGAGEQVVAVDDFSNYPEEAPITDLSGFEPNIEAIAAYEPDLVVVSDDINDVVAALTAIDIPVVHNPAAATLDDTYAQIELLAQATGHPDESSALVASMREDIDQLITAVPETAEAHDYYHELDGSFFTVTSATFIGQLYDLAGLDNIADDAEGADTGYPQLSAEYIIEADPDLIFLADTKCCGESLESVAARPGWDVLTAVTRGGVVELDDDIASRWGPRVVDHLAIIVEEVQGLAESR
ncbi:MAG TPA: ABC transporter substrate-binding protein, partial [Acidimicrobiia bacterium]|nr:ABC transporter substrate-binding protein [Acidimicrobiia bacterium]